MAVRTLCEHILLFRLLRVSTLTAACLLPLPFNPDYVEWALLI